MRKGRPPPRGVGWSLVPDSLLRPVMWPRLADTCGSGMRRPRLPLLWATPTPNTTCARCTRRSCQAPPVTRGSVKNLAVGQPAYIISAPQGLSLTFTAGIISALRPVLGSVLIQTDAAVSPGSSGGGLFDRAGRLIGMPCFQLQEGQQLNFALPVDWIVQRCPAARPAYGDRPSPGAALPDWIQRSTALRTPKSLLGPVTPGSN